MAAKSIMIQGTTSDAGKSFLAAALCRIFKQDGYSVAPFKSQNMALNSFITRDGMEMGRAQVMQAEAAGIEPDVRMNPVLLKPSGDDGSQVIVMGEVVGNMRATEYYSFKGELVPKIKQAYNELASEHDIMVLEGAGSPAEINLRADDFVNMGMAKIAGAPVVICGDIDRGGVFASLYGTVALLDEIERPYVKGTVINKFRGDVEILKPGLPELERLCGVPVLGVVPMLHVDLDDEDSLASRLHSHGGIADLDIAAIRLPHLSNFTDFNALDRFPQVSVRYVCSARELGRPDLIILPGSKNTMGDLLWLRQNGLEASIVRLAGEGIPVMGICGGYQMLGEELSDPHEVEFGGMMRGMGLIPTHTVFSDNKTRTRVTGRVSKIEGMFSGLSGASFSGYEIHMGKTDSGNFSNLVLLDGTRHSKDGCALDNVLGTYVHGIFDDGDFAEKLVS
ncbi:MAG: cobyric acid synthase, partial [Coriobacteriales bacterium]